MKISQYSVGSCKPTQNNLVDNSTARVYNVNIYQRKKLTIWQTLNRQRQSSRLSQWYRSRFAPRLSAYRHSSLSRCRSAYPKSGIGTILSPTGGFIIGFVLAAFFVSLLKGVLGRKLGGKLTVVRYIIVTVIIGIPVMYIPGIALYMVYTGADLVSAIVTLTSVFILLDIAKCVIASLIAVPLNKALAKIY